MTTALLRSAAARQLVVVAAGKLVAALAGIAGIRLFTELAPPEVFGEANLILGAVTLGLAVLAMPINEAHIRLYPDHRRAGSGPQLVRLVLRLAVAAALLLGLLIAGWLATGLVHRPSADPALLGAVLCGYALATAVKNVGLNLLNTERRQVRYALATAAEVVLLVGAGTLLLLLEPGILALLAANLCAAAVPALVLAFAGPESLAATVARGRAAVLPARGLLIEVARFGWPFAILSLLTWLMGMFDRYVLAANVDGAALGQYVAIAGIASRVLLLPSQVFNAILRPILYDAAAQGQAAKWRRVAAVWVACAVGTAAVLLLLMHLLARPLLGALVAEEYREGGQGMLLLIGLSFAFLTVAQVLEAILLSFRPSSHLLAARATGAAAAVLAGLALVPSLGAPGAALASVSGHGAMLSVLVALLVLGRGTMRAAMAQPAR